MYKLADGIYDTCPKFGPQVYMQRRQVIVKDNSVSFIDKNDGRDWSWYVPNFFDVNNIWDKETGKSHVVSDDKNYSRLD